MRSLTKTARRGFHYSILAIVPLLAGVGGANATIVASPVASYTQAFTLSGSQPSSFSLASFNPALGGMVTSTASFVPGTLGVGGNGSATGDVTIAYTYEALNAPIPAPFLLLGSGLIGLAGARRQWKGIFFGRCEN